MFDVSKLPIVVAASPDQAENLSGIADSMNFYAPTTGSTRQHDLIVHALHKAVSTMLGRLLNPRKGMSTFMGIHPGDVVGEINGIHTMCPGVGLHVSQRLNILVSSESEEAAIRLRRKLTFTTASHLVRQVFSNARTLTPSSDFIEFARKHGAYAEDSGTPDFIKFAESRGALVATQDKIVQEAVKVDVSKLPLNIVVRYNTPATLDTDSLNFYVPVDAQAASAGVRKNLSEAVRASLLRTLSQRLHDRHILYPIHVGTHTNGDFLSSAVKCHGKKISGYNVLTRSTSRKDELLFLDALCFVDREGRVMSVFDSNGYASPAFLAFAARHGAPIEEDSDELTSSVGDRGLPRKGDYKYDQKQYESPVQPLTFEEAVQRLLSVLPAPNSPLAGRAGLDKPLLEQLRDIAKKERELVKTSNS